MVKVPVVRNILEASDRIADENAALFAHHGVRVLNLMGAPGAGKTSLLVETARRWQRAPRWAVIEGDVQSSVDAERLQAAGVQAVQINTGGACHLDGNMVRAALPHLDLDALDLLIVENVGNLVCPAEFRVGEAHKVMVASVTEGDDKPLKYPLMFREASVLVLNKTDLSPHVDFDQDAYLARVQDIHPGMRMLPLSCRTALGFEAWIAWLDAFVTSREG
ncbi:MAG: hydrogenase nickel incorporation protein HypB [Pseudomonadota bacterium]